MALAGQHSVCFAGNFWQCCPAMQCCQLCCHDRTLVLAVLQFVSDILLLPGDLHVISLIKLTLTSIKYSEERSQKNLPEGGCEGGDAAEEGEENDDEEEDE